MLSKVVTMEHTTNRENDAYANSEITEELDREKGKVSLIRLKFGETIIFHVEQPENMVYGTKTKVISSNLINHFV